MILERARQFNSPEKPFLTQEEIQDLLLTLRAQRSEENVKMDKEIEEYDTAKGYKVADDKYERDLLEGMSEYFGIDFEVVKAMAIPDADVLLEEFYSKAPIQKHIERWKEKGDKPTFDFE